MSTNPNDPAPSGIKTRSLSAATRHGIVAMVLGMSSFIANDAIIKAVGARVPAAQMVVVRGVMAMALIVLVAWRLGALSKFRQIFSGWVLARASCEGIGTYLYLAALYMLPLANVTAINQASPMFVALLAVLILRERVSAVRWMLIATGFVGVLLIVQPRPGDFNAWAWVAVGATLIYSGRDLLTRFVPAGTPAILITLATAFVVWFMALPMMLVQGWSPMLRSDVLWLALASVFLSGGYYALIVAMRAGDISVIAPFRYVGLLWALLIGYVVWGDMPNVLAWCGIALLIAAGVGMLRTRV